MCEVCYTRIPLLPPVFEIPEITVYGLVCYLCLASKSDEGPLGGTETSK